jgi:hypothetical protein
MTRSINPYYQTQEPKSASISKRWTIAERLAFNNSVCMKSFELADHLPPEALKVLGNQDPTNEQFRRLAVGFNKVSDFWLQVGRCLQIEDFTVEQCLLVLIANHLDSLNVRVNLVLGSSTPDRKHNFFSYFCLSDCDFQGLVSFEDGQLIIPDNLFQSAIALRLNIYREFCPDIEKRLFIPGSDKVEPKAEEEEEEEEEEVEPKEEEEEVEPKEE